MAWAADEQVENPHHELQLETFTSNSFCLLLFKFVLMQSVGDLG